MIFTIFFFFQKSYLFKINIPIRFQKTSLCTEIHSLKQMHYVEHEFYFQFSFATNEQVQMIVKKCKYFFEILIL